MSSESDSRHALQRRLVQATIIYETVDQGRYPAVYGTSWDPLTSHMPGQLRFQSIRLVNHGYSNQVESAKTEALSQPAGWHLR